MPTAARGRCPGIGAALGAHDRVIASLPMSGMGIHLLVLLVGYHGPLAGVESPPSGDPSNQVPDSDEAQP